MAARKKAEMHPVARVVDGMIALRDNCLRELGREESNDKRDELRSRLVEHVGDVWEALTAEAIERKIREITGLPPPGSEEDTEG